MEEKNKIYDELMEKITKDPKLLDKLQKNLEDDNIVDIDFDDHQQK